MKPSNQKYLLHIADKIRAKAKFSFLDALQGKDADCIVKRKNYSVFVKRLRDDGFTPWRWYAPWKRQFVKFENGELVVIDAHIERYECAVKLSTTKQILPPEEQAYLIMYKMVFKKNKRQYDSYLKKLRTQVKKPKLKRLLNTTFRNHEELLHNFFAGKKLHPQYNTLFNIRRAYCFCRNTLFKIIRGVILTLRPYPFVAVMGTDGSGKTTTADGIEKALKDARLPVKRIYGGRFTFQMLPLNWLTKGMAKKKEKEQKTKDAIEYKSGILSFIVPFVYWLEYLLRYLFIIMPARRRGLVLTDRYFYDLVSSPNANMNITRFLIHLLPRPKVIYLYNSLGIIHKRRPRHPLHDIKRQQGRYSANKNLFHTTIKTGTKEQTLRECMVTVLQ